MFTTERKLPATPPFNFQHSLKFLGVFSPTVGEQRATRQTLTKALTMNGTTIAFQVQVTGNPTLQCTLYAEEPLAAAAQEAVYQRIAHFLSLDDG